MRSLTVILPIAGVMAGIEAALIFALRIGLSRGTRWPVTLMAVLAALFLALGVLRHYWDIYVHRTVRGISFIFCGIDALGDLTSLISVFFQPSFDVLGMIIYGVELVLWLGVFACGGYFNLMPWMKRRISSASRRPSSDRSGEDGAEHHTAGRDTSEGITLYDLPSSTSVFRTPSGELAARSRASIRQSGCESRNHIGGSAHIA